MPGDGVQHRPAVPGTDVLAAAGLPQWSHAALTQSRGVLTNHHYKAG